MKRLHIIYDVEGWAYFNRALALMKHAPADWHVTASSGVPFFTAASYLANDKRSDSLLLASVPDSDDVMPDPKDLDVVFLLEASLCEVIATQINPHNTALVVGFNVGYDLRKEFAHQLIKYDRIDTVLFNNREYWHKLGQLKKTAYISNGVDLSVFRETCPLLDRPKKALWSGSQCWQDLKGYNILKSVLPQLLESGYDLELGLTDSYQPKRTHDQMPDFYNSGQIFCCASLMEGTPNPALEAAACGCVLVSTSVGNMPELIKDKENGVLVSRDSTSILEGINYARYNLSRLANNMQTSIKEWDWPIRTQQYFKLFDTVLRG